MASPTWPPRRDAFASDRRGCLRPPRAPENCGDIQREHVNGGPRTNLAAAVAVAADVVAAAHRQQPQFGRAPADAIRARRYCSLWVW